MECMCPDIIRLIFNRLKFIDQICIRLVSKHFIIYPITNLFIGEPLKLKLNDEILQLYPLASSLDISGNKYVTNINHMTSLLTLNISCHISRDMYDTDVSTSNINIDGFSKLTNLTELDMSGIKKITDLNSLINLRILSAKTHMIYAGCSTYYYYDCEITNRGISSLIKLTELYIDDNITITNINSLINLRLLHAPNTKINNGGVSKLTNLTELNVNSSDQITNISHMTNLLVLSASGDCGIDNTGISNLTKIVKLDISNNFKITNVSHMINLRKVYCNHLLKNQPRGLIS